ncbi:acyl-CoA dehydrogenase family protein [bacterium]|nr:acyl-CoA dehydrogenase family protein [candidate division CSSED10-310 bacterium]
MDVMLTEQNKRYQGLAREVAEQVARPVAAEMDRTGEYPWQVLAALKAAGLTGIWIPEEYGGRGGTILDLCLVVEELSRVDGGVGVSYAVNALGSLPILLGGTEAQRRAYLPEVAAGDKLIAFGLSEPDAGSDAVSLKTTARRDGDQYVLNGTKKWNTNGGVSHYYTIFAKTDPEKGGRGISSILVEKGTPGFTIGKREDLLGIRCVPVHELHFNDCRVSVGNLVGGKEGLGFSHAMMTLDRGRPGVAAQAVGLAQGALELALAYTTERRQFGQEIAGFQGVQFMLADMAARVEAARCLVYAAARAIDAGVRNVSPLAAKAKLFATDTAMQVTTDAVQLFGGYGYCRDYPVEKFFRDAKITQIYEGTNQIQRIVIARSLMKGMNS